MAEYVKSIFPYENCGGLNDSTVSVVVYIASAFNVKNILKCKINSPRLVKIKINFENVTSD